MSKVLSPIETKPLEHCSLKVFLDALASDAMIPGAGAASGVALALAAACAGKAVAISRRHDDHAELAVLQTKFAELRDGALALAEADALLFKQHLQSHDKGVQAKLLRTDRRILEGCQKLNVLLDEHEQRIAGNMNGDWQAARGLSEASRLIQEMNLRELEEQ